MRFSRGFTLVEVLVALALLTSATLVLLSAQQASLTSLKTSNQRIEAQDLVRELIAEWKLAPKGFRPPFEGKFAAETRLHWMRSEEPLNEKDSKLGKVTLKILRSDDNGVDTVVDTYVWLEMVDAKLAR